MAEKDSEDYLVFDLDAVEKRKRQRIWRDTVNEFFYECDLILADDFSTGRVEGFRIDDLSVARVETDAMTVHRTKSHLSRDALDSYFVLLPDDDRLSLVQRGREAVVGAGQFAMVSASEAYLYRQGSRTSSGNFVIPGRIMRQIVPHVEDGIALASRNSAICAMFVSQVKSLCDNLEGLNSQSRYVASRQAVELLGLALDGAGYASGESAVKAAHRRRIGRLIERNYMNPHFGVHDISSTLKLSERYVQSIFAAAHETPSSAVRTRRIEAAKQMLQMRHISRLSISEIAYSVGFSSLSHFSRVFKEETGCSPKNYILSDDKALDIGQDG